MAQKELSIVIRMRDKASKDIRSVKRKIKMFARSAKKSFKSIKKAIFSVKGALLGLAGAAGMGIVVKSFVKTASTIENTRLTLKALMGDVDQANKLFDDLATFAGRVPFELQEIIRVGTMFSGVFSGDEIRNLMPLVADLAAVVKPLGITFEQTGMQLQRMFTSGAASADLFREKGVSAMLGFTAKTQYTAEQTKNMIIDAWEKTDSKFRGSAESMADTWDGKMSMISDAWFQFQRVIMDSRVFDEVKIWADALLIKMREIKAEGKNIGESVAFGMEIATKAMGYFGSFTTRVYQGLMIFGVGILQIKQWALQVEQAVVSTYTSSAKKITAFIKWAGTIVASMPFQALRKEAKGLLLAAEKGSAALTAMLENTGEKIQKVTDETKESLLLLREEMDHTLAQDLPHERVNAFFLNLRTQAVETARVVAEADEKIRQDRAMEPPGGFISQEDLQMVTEWSRVTGHAMTVLNANWTPLVDKARKFHEELEATEAKVMFDEMNQAIDDYNSKLQETTDSIMRVGNVFASSFTGAIGELIDGTKKWGEVWKDAARGFMKDIALMITKTLVLKAIQAAASGIGGALFGGVSSSGVGAMPAGWGATPEFANTGVGSLPHAARGMVVQGPTALVAGDNPGGREAVLPIDTVNGKVGVNAKGLGGGNTYNITVNAVDASGVAAFFMSNKDLVAAATQVVVGEQGPGALGLAG